MPFNQHIQSSSPNHYQSLMSQPDGLGHMKPLPIPRGFKQLSNFALVIVWVLSLSILQRSFVSYIMLFSLILSSTVLPIDYFKILISYHMFSCLTTHRPSILILTIFILLMLFLHY